MCAPVLIPLASAVIGAGASIYTSNKIKREEERNRKQQESLSRQQAATRTEMEGQAVNLDEGAVSPSGIGNTFLTGAGGVSSDQLNLSGGKNLLGG